MNPTHADLELMRRTGTLKAIGEQNVYETVRAAVSEAQHTDNLPQGQDGGP